MLIYLLMCFILLTKSKLVKVFACVLTKKGYHCTIYQIPNFTFIVSYSVKQITNLSWLKNQRYAHMFVWMHQTFTEQIFTLAIMLMRGINNRTEIVYTLSNGFTSDPSNIECNWWWWSCCWFSNQHRFQVVTFHLTSF